MKKTMYDPFFRHMTHIWVTYEPYMNHIWDLFFEYEKKNLDMNAGTLVKNSWADSKLCHEKSNPVEKFLGRSKISVENSWGQSEWVGFLLIYENLHQYYANILYLPKILTLMITLRLKIMIKSCISQLGRDKDK